MSSHIELRRDAMHAASSAGVDAPRVAEELYRFLTNPDGVTLPEPPEGMTYVLEPSNAAHIEIGGQRMTVDQFEAARRPLLDDKASPPALAVGDSISTPKELEALPVGTTLEDRDGDRHTLHADGWSYGNDTHYALGSHRAVIPNYLPATIRSLPTQ